MKKRIILLGCGGHAKSVADAVEANNEYEIAGFVDNNCSSNTIYHKYNVIGCDKDLQALYHSGIHYACVAVGFLGHGRIRNKLYKQLKEIGYGLPAIIDPSAVLASDVRLGEGAFIGKRAVVNADTFIGKMAIINTAAIIEHDCVIGDFSHVAVSSTICGMANIGINSFIGANATVIQGITIGNGSIIGAGSTILKDVEGNMKIVNKIVPMYMNLVRGGGYREKYLERVG